MSAGRHFYHWDTFAGDELGNCPQGCLHMIVTKRTCRYCWARFTPAKPTDTHCSSTCKARTQAWDAWIRETQREAIYGRPGPKAPRGGSSLVESVARFTVDQLELAS